MAGGNWLDILFAGVAALCVYGVSKAAGKDNEEAKESVRAAGESVQNWTEKKTQEMEKKIEERKRYYDRYDTEELKRRWMHRDELSGNDKVAIHDLLVERGVIGG